MTNQSVIKAVREYHTRWASAYANELKRDLSLPFFEIMHVHGAGRKAFAEENDEPIQLKALNLTLAVLQAADLNHIPQTFDNCASRFSRHVIEHYEQQLQHIFFANNGATKKDQYQLAVDLRFTQLAKIKALILQNLSPTVVLIQDIGRSRQVVEAHFSHLQTIMKGNVDWGYYAKCFGSGILIGANPLIGIPSFIANAVSGTSKRDENYRQLEVYLSELTALEEKLFGLGYAFGEPIKAASTYFEAKFVEVNVEAVTQILADLTRDGEPIEGYLRTFDWPTLEAAESKFSQFNDFPWIT